MNPTYAVVLSTLIACSYGCKTAPHSNRLDTDLGNGTKTEPPKKKATVRSEERKGCTSETILDPAKPGSPGNLLASTVNPNGDSEMAVLMRVMRDDLREARDQLLRNVSPKPLLENHSKIRCSWPTDPNVRDAKFDQMAISYLLAIEDLEREKAINDKKMAYGRALNACVTCHQNTCPGPISAIKALELPQ